MYSFKNTQFFIIFFLSLTVSQLNLAQENTLVSKEEVLVKVLKNNASIKISDYETSIARGDYNQTNAFFLPNITVSHAAITTNNPLMAFGSKLNQEILTSADFNPDLLNNPSQIQDYITRVEINQPIINVDGIYQRKAANAKLMATKLKSNRTKDYVVLNVEKAYMNLQLAYKAVGVLEKAKKTALENKRLANNSFKQGYLQKADVLSVDVRVTEIDNQLQYAKSNILNVSNELSFLMNDNSLDIMKPSDSLTVITENISISKLSENRNDVKAMQQVSKAYEQKYKADKMSFLPRLNAFGSYELHDDEIFQGNANGYLLGAELRWNVLEGTKRFGKAKKSKAEFEKSKTQYQQYIDKSQVDLKKAYRMYQDTKNNLRLTTLALEHSKESLRIRSNRFKQGLERTTDLLITETQYVKKQLEYYTAVFQHNYALAYIKFLTNG
jgi:outer membrane protein TolC